MTTSQCTYAPNDTLVIPRMLLETLDPPTALDITGGEFIMQVRSQTDSSTVLAEASTTNGKITIVPLSYVVNGITLNEDGIQISFTAADTLAIYQGTTLEYAIGDLRMTLPSSTEPFNGVLCIQFVPEIYSTRPNDFPINGACP